MDAYYVYFPVLLCLSVSVKWLAVKTASEMTYLCVGWGVKLYSLTSTWMRVMPGHSTDKWRTAYIENGFCMNVNADAIFLDLSRL